MDPTKELYFSLDIETNGPIPGQNSMLSVGCAAFKLFDQQPVSEFSCNLVTLPDAKEDAKTMAWWKENQAAYDKTRTFTKTPAAMTYHFNQWVDQIAKARNAKPVLVAYPAGFDFTFLYWYLMKFSAYSPFSFACLDIKTLAFATGLFKSYRDTKKSTFPKSWFPKTKHTHVAIDDAIEQGQIFVNIMSVLFSRNDVAAVEHAVNIVETLMGTANYKQG